MARPRRNITRLVPIEPPKFRLPKRARQFAGLPNHDWRIKGTLEPPKIVLSNHTEAERHAALKLMTAFEKCLTVRASDGKRAFDFIIVAYQHDEIKGVWTFELRSNGPPRRARKTDIRIV
jgi:hypothetical protein